MSAAEAVTLASALIAASVVVIGYWANHYVARRERRTRLYADALEALADHEELPYLIWRRVSLDAAVLTERISRGHGRLRHYETLLHLDSPAVGAAFADLANATRAQGEEFRRLAWQHPVRDDQTAQAMPARIAYDTHRQRNHCLEAMQLELSPWARLRRRLTWRRGAVDIEDESRSAESAN